MAHRWHSVLLLALAARALPPMSRRRALTGVAVLETVPANAFEVKLPFSEDAEAKRKRLTATLEAPPISDEVRACGSRLVGTYTDPKHPGCERRVAQIAGTRFASIRGVNEDGSIWIAGASIACAGYGGVDREPLVVDFTLRGGGKDVVALADYSATSATLTFPDGNAWTMVPCTNPNLKTAQQRAACASGVRAF